MRNQKYTNVQVDGYTRVCLTAIAVLLTILVIGLWAEGPARTSEAGAADKYRDAKAARAFKEGRWGTSSARGKLSAIQQETNAKLDKLINLFKSGEARVQIVQPAGQVSGGVGNVVQNNKK